MTAKPLAGKPAHVPDSHVDVMTNLRSRKKFTNQPGMRNPQSLAQLGPKIDLIRLISFARHLHVCQTFDFTTRLAIILSFHLLLLKKLFISCQINRASRLPKKIFYRSLDRQRQWISISLSNLYPPKIIVEVEKLFSSETNCCCQHAGYAISHA